jgi:hypothetical protein
MELKVVKIDMPDAQGPQKAQARRLRDPRSGAW